MSNNLNINTSNLGFAASGNNMMLKQAVVYLDFHDGNGQLALGYIEKEISIKATTQYVSFKTGIPETEVRRDMISQEFTVEAKLKQFQKEVIALALQRYLDESDETYDRVIIGSSVPSPVFPSCVIKCWDVSGVSKDLYIRKLQITAEDVEIMLGGGDYAGIPFKGTALVDSAPLTTNPTWPYNPAMATQDNIAFWQFPKDSSSGS